MHLVLLACEDASYCDIINPVRCFMLRIDIFLILEIFYQIIYVYTIYMFICISYMIFDTLFIVCIIHGLPT